MPTDCYLCLYADAGGTKTTWAWTCAPIGTQEVVSDGSGHNHLPDVGNDYVTLGINPNTMSEDVILGILEDARGHLMTRLAAHGISWLSEADIAPPPSPTYRIVQAEVLYYGAGCGAKANRELMTGLLGQVFQHDRGQELLVSVDVYVDTDLAFAGLTQWGDEAGLVAILGTGCNAGLWQPQPSIQDTANGKVLNGPTGKIIASAPSLGFWLGDEGGGAWVGKQIIKDYLLGQVPAVIIPALDQVLGPRENLLQRFYQSASPAAMAGAVMPNLGALGSERPPELQPWLDQYIKEGFQVFVQTYVLPLSAEHGYKGLRCVGGMAWHYQDILVEVVSDAGLQVDRVVQTPRLASK